MLKILFEKGIENLFTNLCLIVCFVRIMPTKLKVLTQDQIYALEPVTEIVEEPVLAYIKL